MIPKHPIDEHDIYEIMKGLFFEQEQQIIYEKVCIVKENKKEGIKAEYDKVEVCRLFVWNLYEK